MPESPHTLRPESPWYELKAEAGRQTAELWIYEVIGETWYGEGITAKNLVRDLADLDAERLDVHINSPGGSVFDGQAIYNALRRYPGAVDTYIDGLAASIASVIAMAGERIVMAGNALMMIHNPIGLTYGTATDHRKTAEALDKAGETIAGVYQTKATMDRDEIHAAMDAETWYTAQEAADAGFAVEIDEPVPMAALSRFEASDLTALGYRHIPEQLLAAARVVPVPTTDTAEGSAEEPSPQQAAEAALCRETVFLPGIGYRNLASRRHT